MLSQCDDRDYQLHSVASIQSAVGAKQRAFLNSPKCRIEQTAERFSCSERKFFSGVAQHGSQGYDSNEVDDENSNGTYVCEMDADPNRYHEQQDVDRRIENRSFQLAYRRKLLLWLFGLRAWTSLYLVGSAILFVQHSIHEFTPPWSFFVDVLF